MGRDSRLFRRCFQILAYYFLITAIHWYFLLQATGDVKEYAESDDGLSLEVEQVNHISTIAETEIDMLNSGETATYVIVPQQKHAQYPASAEKVENRKGFLVVQTPVDRIYEDQHEQTSKVESLLGVISERRIKARLEALASSPWSSSLSEGEDTDPQYFAALAGVCSPR